MNINVIVFGILNVVWKTHGVLLKLYSKKIEIYFQKAKSVENYFYGHTN